MMSLSDVLSAVLPVFFLALVGIGLRRVRWLTEEADATLLRLVVNVLTPCLIFDKVLGNQALQRAENLFIPPLMGFGASRQAPAWVCGRDGWQLQSAYLPHALA